MRRVQLERAVVETRAQKVDARAVRTLPNVFVARMRCVRLRPRCSYETVGVRRPDEWVDWSATTCAKCGAKRLHLVGESYAELEVNAAVQVFRWREIPVPGADGGGEPGEWRYLPFALAGQIEALAGAGDAPPQANSPAK